MSKKTNTPVRVLQVVTVMNRAGLETMLMNYYRAIDRTKVQFDFLVHRAERGDYDDEIEKLGGKIYRFSPMTIRSMFGYRKKMKNFLLEHPEYKVVHSHIDALSALPLSGAKDAGIPTRIAHSHNNNFSIDKKWPIRIVLKQIIHVYATALFTCSHEAGRFMFGKRANYQIMANAVDTDTFSYDKTTRNRIRKKLNIEENFVLGHVGRFTHQKNHEFLINVFSKVKEKHKNATLLLVGTGEGESEAKQRVKSLGLESSVYFLGLRTDIPELMQAMDVFVMPSRYEGLPVVSIESQSTGLPCIFSRAVTEELDITGVCRFLDLKAPLDAWAQEILDCRNLIRKDFRAEIVAEGYDIADAALRLQFQYFTYASKGI